jgi:hypothetical protein
MSTTREAATTVMGIANSSKDYALPSHRSTLPVTHISAPFPMARKLFMTILDVVRDHDLYTMPPVKMNSLLIKNIPHTW